MQTLLVDVEGGAASVRDREGPNLRIEDAPDFPKVEEIFWRIQRGYFTPDVVVIDTLTTMASTTRQDVVIDPKEIAGKSIWQNREKVIPAQRDWGIMTDLIGRLLRMYRQLPAVTVYVCHEREREDPMTGATKIGPDLNPALLQDVIAFSDVVAHLLILPEIEIDGHVYPAGTRRLRIVPDQKYMAKARAPQGKAIPPILLNPTLPQLLSLGIGRKIVVYGFPSAGKTTFACSGAGEPATKNTPPGSREE
jgi:hypothetical protein